MGLGAVVLLGGPWLMGAIRWNAFIILLLVLGGARFLLETRRASSHPGS